MQRNHPIKVEQLSFMGCKIHTDSHACYTNLGEKKSQMQKQTFITSPGENMDGGD